jgi:hypothetical protein
MTVVYDADNGTTRITCNVCGVEVLGLLRCCCGSHDLEREWCAEHACPCLARSEGGAIE